MDLFVGHLWSVKDENKKNLRLAWHVAKLERAKNIPSLKQLLGGSRAKKVEGVEKQRLIEEHKERLEKFGYDEEDAIM